MLFNSYVFIFAFLPFTFFTYFLIVRYLNSEAAIRFLVLASLFFYGWWNPVYLVLILCSIAVNYFFGESLAKFKHAEQAKRAKLLLITGVGFNLALLGYFKYANFLIENLNTFTAVDLSSQQIILPLAISFFTFQQIAYLVDTYKGITEEFDFSHYALFVTFFPQLIAGPIVHHKEMLPQFVKFENMKPVIENVAIGVSIFSIGLFKKVVIADGVAQYSTPVFDAAVAGDALSFFVAWGGALSYTFQLYFDFSGYSDMAIGIGRIFGIRLPINFSSPYKALNIIEFWRRWHITLSRFLRDYLYIAMGGNRHGIVRRYINLFTTMLLGGLWHGAGWTFVFWGGLHGLYLVINHGWHFIKRRAKLGFLDAWLPWRFFCWLITFVSVVHSWVFFRATTFDGAIEVLKGMYGFNGVSLPNAIYSRLGQFSKIIEDFGVTSHLGGGAQFVWTFAWVGILLVGVIFLPNTQQIMKSSYRNEGRLGNALLNDGVFPGLLSFRYNAYFAFLIASMLVFAVFGLTRISEFLYFQF